MLDEQGTRPAERDITLRDLLTMTSGIPYPEDTRKVLSTLFSLFELLDTAGMDCRKAISSELTDYEDAMMSETALRCGMDCIVTRNLRDYGKSPVPVYAPSTFLARIEEDIREK